MSDLTVEKLQTNIYKFDENGEEMNVDAFLIIGEKKAIMIDGLMKAKGVLAEVKKLTNLPLEMIIAHGHPDHAVQIPDYRGDEEGYINLVVNMTYSRHVYGGIIYKSMERMEFGVWNL